MVIKKHGRIPAAAASLSLAASFPEGHPLGQERERLSTTHDNVPVWNTFLGGQGVEEMTGNGLAVDNKGSVYLTGESFNAWGEGECSGCPLRPFTGPIDGFAAKLMPGGELAWHTFLGGSDNDFARAVSAKGDDEVYVAGISSSKWSEGECSQCPRRVFEGAIDAFVTRLDSNGTLIWNTFLGSRGGDIGVDVATDADGDLYVMGTSGTPWGAPIRPFGGDGDAFAARLNHKGMLKWNLFLGGSGHDEGRALTLDSGGNVLAAGISSATWAEPVHAYLHNDPFVAKIPPLPGCSVDPDKPLLIQPANGALKKGPTVRLDWSDATCANKYTVVVKEGGKSGPIVFKSAGVSESQVRTPELISGRTYYCRVIAKNEYANSKSAWYEFTLK